VGLPNAGKSTLISVISAARPKIADYPFTTLVPNLGIVQIDGGQGFVVADIPGLIEGAHLGKGLGIQFLRHIERTKVLVFLLDGTREDPKADFALLLKELKLFKADLAKRPRLIAITKADALQPSELKKARSLAFGRTPVLAISAVAGTGIRDLVEHLGTMLRRTASKVDPEATEDRPRGGTR
jgi:GTP-binding protein